MSIKKLEQLPDSARLAVTEIKLVNSSYDEQLWQTYLNPLIDSLQDHSIEEIRTEPRILATRKAYKNLGLDPSRYRPSSESLLRRVSKGNGLYQINTLVDFNNYLSLLLRFPVGSYDKAKIAEPIVYGVGGEGQCYDGIGKKSITINHFPILIDQMGPFGSLISDSTKAMISLETEHALLIVYCFDETEEGIEKMQTTIKGAIENMLPKAQVIQQLIV